MSNKVEKLVEELNLSLEQKMILNTLCNELINQQDTYKDDWYASGQTFARFGLSLLIESINQY